MMIHKSDIQGFINDIDFKWDLRATTLDTEKTLGYNITKEERVLQYRVQKGTSFRGWSNWQDVKEEVSK